MIRVLLLMSALFLAACQTSGGTFCDVSKPIRLSDAVVDLMSDTEVESALAHNEKGAKMCGWKP